MRYMLLIYQDDKEWADADEAERGRVYAEHARFVRLLQEHNALLGGAELALSNTATTVRNRPDVDSLITDGPFAETVEALGGYYLVEADDLDQAIAYAKACPAETVEVRAIVPGEAS